MNTETLTDLMVMGFCGLLFWGMGFVGFTRSNPISIPAWLSYLCGKKPGHTVYLRPFALQIFGLLSVGWTIILALLVPDHAQRVSLFSIGMLVIGVFASAIIGFGLSRRR
jgi:hypothetical protein